MNSKDGTRMERNSHSRNFKDLTGQRFGRVIVLGFAGRSDCGNSRWKAKCDCGVIFETFGASLKNETARAVGVSGASLRPKETEL